jgi:predicted RNase H-like HicB family nuclease
MNQKHAIHIKAEGMKTYVFRVVIEPDEERFYAEIPALPDCHSWGYTYEEALKNMKEAAELCLEAMIQDGQPIPEEDSRPCARLPSPSVSRVDEGQKSSTIPVCHNITPQPIRECLR